VYFRTIRHQNSSNPRRSYQHPCHTSRSCRQPVSSQYGAGCYSSRLSSPFAGGLRSWLLSSPFGGELRSWLLSSQCAEGRCSWLLSSPQLDQLQGQHLSSHHLQSHRETSAHFSSDDRRSLVHRECLRCEPKRCSLQLPASWRVSRTSSSNREYSWDSMDY
jgi:hypothetical protein